MGGLLSGKGSVYFKKFSTKGAKDREKGAPLARAA